MGIWLVRRIKVMAHHRSESSKWEVGTHIEYLMGKKAPSQQEVCHCISYSWFFFGRCLVHGSQAFRLPTWNFDLCLGAPSPHGR